MSTIKACKPTITCILDEQISPIELTSTEEPINKAIYKMRPSENAEATKRTLAKPSNRKQREFKKMDQKDPITPEKLRKLEKWHAAFKAAKPERKPKAYVDNKENITNYSVQTKLASLNEK